MKLSKISKKKWIWISLSIIAVLLLASGSYAAYLYNKTSNVVEQSHEKTGRVNEQSALRDQDEKVDPVTDNVSILFLGVDDSEKRSFEEGSRTDALLVATFNQEDDTVKLLTIPRDTYTYIPEVGYKTKINHAHFYGGPRAAMETVESFLHTPIDYYVRVDFDAFIEVVDSINGITYDVPFELEEMDSHDKKDAIHLYPGKQKLNGEETLGLVRSRSYDSDIERGKRQQEVLITIAEKVTSASSLFKLNEVIDAVGTNMQTNLSFNQMKSFLSYGTNENVDIEKLNLEGDGGYMDDGVWYYHADEDKLAHVQRELRKHLDLPAYTSKESDEEDTDDNSPTDNKYSDPERENKPHSQQVEPGADETSSQSF